MPCCIGHTVSPKTVTAHVTCCNVAPLIAYGVVVQTFFQRVQNYFGHLMNIYVWDNVIAPQMDKTIW